MIIVITVQIYYILMNYASLYTNLVAIFIIINQKSRRTFYPPTLNHLLRYIHIFSSP
jgi:hypothetical protein